VGGQVQSESKEEGDGIRLMGGRNMLTMMRGRVGVDKEEGGGIRYGNTTKMECVVDTSKPRIG